MVHTVNFVGSIFHGGPKFHAFARSETPKGRGYHAAVGELQVPCVRGDCLL